MTDPPLHIPPAPIALAPVLAPQPTRLPILRRVMMRLPVQVVTVAGGLVTAWMIGLLLGDPGSLSPAADLLRFVPIVIGLAANVGIQASTVLVRAFATGEVRPERELPVLASETLVGGIIGAICGGMTFLALGLGAGFAERGLFGLAVGLAIAAAVSWASFLGGAIPIAFRRLGIDPAIAAGPFLVTLSDISGTGLYLGVAHVLLRG